LSDRTGPAVADLAAELEARIGHVFRDRGWLTAAMTHSSLASRNRSRGKRDFDRLEFLGDRVLGLVVADMLDDTFPNCPEGELASRFAALVSEGSLADCATAIGLPNVLRVEAGAGAPDGAVTRPSILADGFEALLGAMYRDGGLSCAEGFLRRCFAARIAAMTEAPRDPKTALQEWLQARGLALPTYRLLASSGPAHAPSFRISVGGGGRAAEGEGPSKRQAERVAAAALLADLEGS
jgi:ribonuclease-3